MKNFKFALVDNTVYEGKDLMDFYSKALLEGSSRTEFTQLVGVKSKVKAPSFNFGDVIKDELCSWNASGEGTLDQKQMEVCAKMIQLEYCTSTFEQNFLSEAIRASNIEPIPADFAAYMVNLLQKKVQNDITLITWQGDTDSEVYPFSECDGLLKKLGDDSSVLTVTEAATITASNVIAEIKKVYDKIPATIIDNPDLAIIVSDHIARLYKSALANASAETYYVGDRELNFLGVRLINDKGMAAGSMVAGVTKNFVLLTDLMSDEEEFQLIPQKEISGIRSVRVVGNFKIGFDYFNGDEIVIYSGAIA